MVYLVRRTGWVQCPRHAWQPVPTYAQPTARFAGVVLESVAPPTAILLIRQPEDWYDEGEIVVDPFALNSVRLA